MLERTKTFTRIKTLNVSPRLQGFLGCGIIKRFEYLIFVDHSKSFSKYMVALCFWAFTINLALVCWLFLFHPRSKLPRWRHTSLCSKYTKLRDLVLYSKCQTKATVQEMYTFPEGQISVFLGPSLNRLAIMCILSESWWDGGSCYFWHVWDPVDDESLY